MGEKPQPIFTALNSWNDALLEASEGGRPSVMVRRSLASFVDSARSFTRAPRNKRMSLLRAITRPIVCPERCGRASRLRIRNSPGSDRRSPAAVAQTLRSVPPSPLAPVVRSRALWSTRDGDCHRRGENVRLLRRVPSSQAASMPGPCAQQRPGGHPAGPTRRRPCGAKVVPPDETPPRLAPPCGPPGRRVVPLVRATKSL
jgi:hypothetical protein